MDQLKLAALDEQDLAILSAHAQDAVAKVGDIDWRPREKRLTIALNRFVWESAARSRKGYERRRALLHFARVDAVRSSRIRRDAPEAVLSLLAIRFLELDAPAGTIHLDFAGGGCLRLEVECIEASLADVGAAWTTLARPAHDLA